MPRHGAHTVEVHLAKCHKEDEEHKQRNDLVEKWRKERSGTIECWRQGKEQVDQDACAHTDRQRPVFQESYYRIILLHRSAKIRISERKTKCI